MILKKIFSQKSLYLIFLVIFLATSSLFFIIPQSSDAEVCVDINLGESPQKSFLVGTDLYVVNQGSISIVDTLTNTVTDEISSSASITYDSELIGTKIFISDSSSNRVFVFNTATQVLGQITVGTTPIFLTPVGTDLYVSNAISDTVSVINTSTNTVSHTISVGDEPQKSTLVGTDLYVSNYNADTVSVIDTVSKTVTDTISVGNSPGNLIQVGSSLYVLNEDIDNLFTPDTLSVIDILTNTVVDTITVGNRPTSPTVIGNDLYVLSEHDGIVSVVDTNTNSVTDTIIVGDTPSFSLAVGTTLYVFNLESDTISVIDSNTNTVTDTIDTDHRPIYGTVVDSYMYILNSDSNNINVLDLDTNTIIPDPCPPILLTSEIDADTLILTYDEDLDEGSIPSVSDFSVTVGGVPVDILSVEIADDIVTIIIDPPTVYGEVVLVSYVVPLLNPTQDLIGNDALAFTNQSVTNNTESCGIINISSNPYFITAIDNSLYVTTTSNEVIIIDKDTFAEIDTISIGNGQHYSTLVGTYLYVNNNADGTVSIIDTDTNTLLDTVAVGPGPYFSTLVGENLYINNSGDGTIAILDTNTNTVTDTISPGVNTYFSTLVGTDLYLSNSESDTVTVLDTNTNTVVDTITVGTAPLSSVLIGTDIYVANHADNIVSVIDTNTNTVTDTINTGFSPYSLTVVGTDIYVGVVGDVNIAVLDINTNTISENIPMLSNPYFGVLIGDLLYVAHQEDDFISIIDTGTNALFTCQVNFNLTYTAGTGGSISGDSMQTVGSGEDGTPVTAVPDSGYDFVSWSDSLIENPRTDLNVTNDVTVNAIFSIDIDESSTGGVIGTSVYGRFINLINMDKFEEAYQLIHDYPHMFTQDEHGQYTFCDNAHFNDFMKKKDIDGNYSVYNNGTVTEISKLQSFVNKLFMFQYIQASGPVDGIFGPLTKIGVERLQNLLNGAVELDKDLVIDGIVGPLTKSAINSFCLPGYVL